MPTQFCNLPYIALYIDSYICLICKFFPIFCRYLCEMFVVVLLVTFIMPVIHPLSIAVVVVSYFCVYLSCWVATYVCSWINIYRGQTNNGNTGQYRNKTVCVGLHWKNISYIFHYSFVCLCCIVPLSMHCRLCLATVCVKVLQNGKLLRLSKRTDC